MELLPTQRALLLGTRGHLDLPAAWTPAGDQPCELIVETSPALERPAPERMVFPATDQYARLVEAFATAAAGGDRLGPVPLEDSLKNQAVLDALARSTASGRCEPVAGPIAGLALGLAIGLTTAGCHRTSRPTGRMTLSVVGTNDLHGHLESLPVFGGFLANLRRVRAQDGGVVLLVDAGDMFQGTLESNLNEGHAVVRAYAALGYAAVAVGNHEFDYGPVGPAVTAAGPGDDRRGALRARAAEAPFPFLAANLIRHRHGAGPGLGPRRALGRARAPRREGRDLWASRRLERRGPHWQRTSPGWP